MTRYEYDDAGRLVRSVTIPESEWSPADVSLLVMSRMDERDRGPHGFPMSEATDPANQFKFQGQEKPLMDWAEKARKDSQDAFYKQRDTKDNPVNRNGHIWGVSKRDD